MTAIRRSALPALGAALIGIVLAVQWGNGGGSFVPLTAADPCAVRTVSSVSTGIDGLTERLVLLGLDRGACRLGVTRETFILQLAQQREPTTAQVTALRAGLNQAVDLMKQDGTLPPASQLVDPALDSADINGLLKAAIRALPASVINASLKTDDVLHRTIAGLDLRAMLANLSDPNQLTRDVNAAVTKAVKESLENRLRHLL
jgi:hypothetical protein